MSGRWQRQGTASAHINALRSEYYKGMRLFITFPFTFAQDPMACEYLAEVVRVERVSRERVGVAVHLLMKV
jgi:hypothetical protein